MKFFRNEKGEFTVEAALVFSVSFMAIIVFLYIGVVMYQHVHLQSLTDRIASRGAMMYATRTTDMSSGYKSKDSFWQSDPYRYIFDGSYKNIAQAQIRNELNAQFVRGNITTQKSDGVTAEVKLGPFSRRVEVRGHRSFNVPFVSSFNINNSIFDLNVKSTAYIMDMPETIRNVDYAADMLRRNKTVAGAIGKVGELKGKLQSFIEKIK